MPFHFHKTELPDIIEVQPKKFGDHRGWFAEIYKATDFAQNGIGQPFVQVNHSKSSRGILRGLHYQKDPMAQGKLVSVVAGEVFDVGVDIRRDSATFGQWVGRTLTAEDKNMLFIPAGFAHGFCVTSETAEVIYYCTEVYSPEHDAGVRWDDPQIGIAWPLTDPILSEKDQVLPGLKDLAAL